MSVEEDARLAIYLQQQENRRKAEILRERQLAGNPVARADLQARWQPLIDARRGNYDGGQEPDRERKDWSQRV